MKKLIIFLFSIFVFSLSTLAKEPINIAFTIDNNYPIFTLLVINSILKNNTSNSDYNFYIIEDNMTDKNKAKMSKFVKKHNQNIEFINIDTNALTEGTVFSGMMLKRCVNSITPIAFAKLALPDILPKDVHKILYLDSDILVTTDLRKLYDTNLNGKWAGLVLNETQFTHAAEYTFDKYYNVGVILVDVDKWREVKATEKLVNFLKENKHLFIEPNKVLDGKYYEEYKYFILPEQDLFNVVFKNKIKELPGIYNMQKIEGLNKLDDEDIKGILHFVGTLKPWNFIINPNKSTRMYLQYWNDSSLRGYKLKYAAANLRLDYRYYYLCHKKLLRLFKLSALRKKVR